MEPVRVLVADDHPIVCDGLSALLTNRVEVELAGVATDGAEVVRLAEELQPDVIVMDLHMPKASGTDAIGKIARTSPHIAVLVLTMLEDDDSLFAAMRAGARGYLVKGAAQDEIFSAILAVARGEAVFGPAVASRVLDYFFREPPGRTRDLFPELTDRERDVLELIAQGLGKPGDKRSPRPQRQDRSQLRLEYLHQAARRRSSSSDRRRVRSRTRSGPGLTEALVWLPALRRRTSAD